jgi:hypothetical protein
MGKPIINDAEKNSLFIPSDVGYVGRGFENHQVTG